MNSQRIFVLRALNEEHHQKRDYRRARVDYELPCVGEVKERPGQPPHDNDHQGKHESHGGAGGLRSLERKSFQYLTKITSFVSHHNHILAYSGTFQHILVHSDIFSAGKCQKMSECTRMCWNVPEYARMCQNVPKSAGKC